MEKTPPKYLLDFEKPIYELEQKIEEMKSLGEVIDIENEIETLQNKITELKVQIYNNLTRWQRVQIARHPERPYTLDYISNIFTDFVELHGDRLVRDDPAIVGGIAKFNGKSILVVGHQKGRDTKSNLYRNFGMPNPEGYRKAHRLFLLAEKFNKPIITFLDTPGAFPGMEAEERGQAEAIARNLFLMAKLRVPIIVVIIGEGASGGAIGIGVGDRILMLENAWYSVISPESCSSILWRSWDFKEQAAEALKLTAKDLLELKVIDRIVPEPLGGAHKDHKQMFEIMREVLAEELDNLMKIDIETLVKMRKEKFYRQGVWKEL
ncbi:MAG: Acetyl-coenzyme A carboxyl transferase alpha chain [Candidatus Kapaibacterium sp.]|jgi:acetyl-CoA carboxylase carboxyl transferase subunit alpha|nr:MAG: Acetyl-coenzyme A carboxyl transferase alpha chain [Candidatus Kapabacteria bacterium]ROL57899.1 MAG: acetyl-CoA carboxylase carboxyltransferase subunit alpha [Bacteroidetes/Chlorobi group bacterium Naka2016]